MLVAKRDPFHPTAQNTSHSDFFAEQRPNRAAGFSRTMTALQMLGTLLGIPLAIASGYTMYHANFSSEATCQSLRANIVSMLDKSVDARTRHMLVRKDVESFEQSCGRVDPDATAAFKALLASDRAAAVAPRTEPKPVEAKAKEIVRKAEPKVEVKTVPHDVAAAPAKPAPADAAMSDAAWLAAVRGALTPDDAEPAKPAKAKEAVINTPPPVPLDAAHPNAELRVSPPPPPPPAAASPAAAPLPPPSTIANAPAPQADGNHPVPPAEVPAAQPGEPAHHSWIGRIPFVGQMIESKR